MKRLLFASAALVTLSLSAYSKPGWTDDFEQGLAKAKAENKPAVVNFTGSDWCHWCKKLDGEVFSKEKFKQEAKEKYVLIELDFPQGRKLAKKKLEAQEAVMKKYGVRGFPTVVVLDGDGKELGRLGYTEGGPEAFLNRLDSTIAK